jgi:hypothetical protein
LLRPDLEAIPMQPTHPTPVPPLVRSVQSPAVPALTLGVVLLYSTVAALLPFALVLGWLYYGRGDSIDYVLTIIAIYFVAFPIAVRVLSPCRPGPDP